MSILTKYSSCDGTSVTLALAGVDPTVKTAGIIEFRRGKIYKVDNVSGHFKPSAHSLQNSESIFNQNFTTNNFATDFQGYIPFTN